MLSLGLEVFDLGIQLSGLLLELDLFILLLQDSIPVSLFLQNERLDIVVLPLRRSFELVDVRVVALQAFLQIRVTALQSLNLSSLLRNSGLLGLNSLLPWREFLLLNINLIVLFVGHADGQVDKIESCLEPLFLLLEHSLNLFLGLGATLQEGLESIEFGFVELRRGNEAFLLLPQLTQLH